MAKVKLFRKGRYVGLVKENFHGGHKTVRETSLWDNLEINSI